MQIDQIFSKNKNKHPPVLYVLSLAATLLRYSFWGVGNLLVLFLIQYYQFSDERATHVFGIFTGFAAILPLVGGLLADKWNYYGPLFLGTLLSAIGCYLLSLSSLTMLYIGLALIAVGYGVFVPSTFTILNYVYRFRPALREAGFSLFYSFFNVGVFVAMISLGYIAQTLSWMVAWKIAAVVQLAGLIPCFWYYKKYHVHFKNIHPSKHHHLLQRKEKIGPIQIQRIIVILIFCFASIAFWTAYTQGWSSMSIFALKYTQKDFGGFVIPTAWLLSTEALFLIILAPLLAKLYGSLQKVKKDPSAVSKSGISFMSMTLTFVIMMIASYYVDHIRGPHQIGPQYITLAFFFMAIAEMLIAPIGLSHITRLSPKKLTAFFVGFYYLCSGGANYLGGYLAGFISKFPNLFDFFLLFFWMCLVPGIVLLIFAKVLFKMGHENRL